MHKKPRINFLIPRLGIRDRGAEVFIYELAKNLRHDFEITIWVRYIAKKSKMILDLEKHGVLINSVKSIDESHWLLRVFYSLRPLQRALEKFHLNPSEIEMLVFSFTCLSRLVKGDTNILFPANGVWGAIGCRIVRFFRKIPFVCASLGGIEPMIARQNPNAYIAINPGIAGWLKSHYPHLNVTFISTGVDLKKFNTKGKKAEIHLPRPIFITVSALVPEKRLDLTIKAVSKLKKGSLLIIGDGPLKSKLVAEAKKYLGKGRFLFQKVAYHDLPKFYRAGDVFTFSAPWEVGWSMVHLEALASGLPIVANREANIELLMGNDRLLCNVNDSEEYSLYLKKASRMERGLHWQNKVINYSWEKIAARYTDVLLKLLN